MLFFTIFPNKQIRKKKKTVTIIGTPVSGTMETIVGRWVWYPQLTEHTYTHLDADDEAHRSLGK